MESVVSSLPYLDAYRQKSTLVTGHTGFKGSWLAMWLQRLGADVTGFALDPEEGSESLFIQAEVAESMDSIIGDVRSLSAVVGALERSRPEIVFHLAAQAFVRRSYTKPVETLETNVMGTVNVLEAVRSTPGVKAVVIVTSDKCYENPETVWARREDDPMGGADPYSASKGCAELVTSAYRRSFFEEGPVLLASARAGNVIGAGDASIDRLVPDIVRSITGGEPIVMRNPSSIRPWQHVLEPLRGYLMLGAGLLDGDRRLGEGWNFGPDDADAVPVADLAGRVIAAWGEGTLVEQPDSDAPREAGFLSLDISKARSRLGFRPVLGLEGAIRLTVEGYRDMITAGIPPRDVLSRQLDEYTALLG